MVQRQGSRCDVRPEYHFKKTEAKIIANNPQAQTEVGSNYVGRPR